ncbi:bifunctional protein-serine/threonine kinase/phosphatase [Asticcacaulis biprosthecium]|nr:bifunctional protein-serine/threonine kinase/phosphatase [Asticcacaulis biprosthecium]
MAAPRLRVASGFASDIGHRDENQDFAAACLEDLPRHHGLVAAVADGVGGAKGGRVAAELTVRSFIDDYLSQSDALPPRKTAARALESINHWLHVQGTKDAKLKGMSAVFTGVVVKGHRMHSFHVGDTRLYRLRDGQLSLLTKDHKPEGAEDSHYITRAIGMEESVRIDYRVHDVAIHDRILLSSDGVHGPLKMAYMTDVLNARAAPDETARKLVADALAAGGTDNATALVIDIVDLPPTTLEDLDAVFASLPIHDPPKVGEMVDDFKLESILSDSDYSRVFRARDTKEHRAVLLKFPRQDTIGSEATARAAFAREAWVATRVHHIFIGAVLTLPPKRQTRLYIAQPFYEGETLEKRLLRAPVPLAEGLEIALKLAKAIAALHRAGIIHRDIKPENIILTPDGGLKLIDLGVARLPHLDTAREMDHVPGTASYRAPEMFDGNSGDEQTDIFALGVTLYRMFSGGSYPYGEIEPFVRPRLGKAEPLTAKRQDVPAWLENLIRTAIAPDPDERFQDGFELAYQLENGALSTASVPARRETWARRNPEKLWQAISLLLFLALLVVGLGRL